MNAPDMAAAMAAADAHFKAAIISAISLSGTDHGEVQRLTRERDEAISEFVTHRHYHFNWKSRAEAAEAEVERLAGLESESQEANEIIGELRARLATAGKALAEELVKYRVTWESREGWRVKAEEAYERAAQIAEMHDHRGDTAKAIRSEATRLSALNTGRGGDA